VVKSDGLGGKREVNMCGGNTGNCIQYFVNGCCVPYCACCVVNRIVFIDVSFKCLVCIVVSCLVHLVVILCVFEYLSILSVLIFHEVNGKY
jgi:hypothetical protein